MCPSDQKPPQRQRGRPKKRNQNFNQNSPGGKKLAANTNNKTAPNHQNVHSPSKQTSANNNKKLELTSENVKALENEKPAAEPVIDDAKALVKRETKSEQYQERIRKAIKKGSEESESSQRPSSAGSFASPENLRERYWSYLFDNFHRAVDEIYLTCENDESVVECQVCN